MTFYGLKFSANIIKMHECYLLSATLYMYVIMAILIMSLHLCVNATCCFDDCSVC